MSECVCVCENEVNYLNFCNTVSDWFYIPVGNIVAVEWPHYSSPWQQGWGQ